VVDQSSTAMKVDADGVLYDLQEEELGPLVEQVAWATPRGEHPMTVNTEPGIRTQADRRHLSEAIGNVIENAAKFSPGRADRHPSSSGGQRLGRDRWRTAGRVSLPSAPIRSSSGSARGDCRLRRPRRRARAFLARAHVLAHSGRVDVAEREDGGTILRITLPAEAEG
jgi:signal transduction histidine kinase